MRKLIFIPCVFMLFASMLFVKLVSVEVNASEKNNVKSYSDHPNFISISVIIDKNQDFDSLYSWLTSLNYTKFTFVVYSFPNESYILDNSTRVNILKQYGKIIPRLPYYQQNSTSVRERMIDYELKKYNDTVGYLPKGIMDFVPDTYSANYAFSKGIEYYQGYCFDQWCIDYITERGGFQMPYYASPTHVLVPSTTGGGMVVLPHSTWDWVASYTIDQNLQEHVDNLMTIFHNNRTLAKNYFLSFINSTFSGCQPFGFVNFQFEWSWTLSWNNTDVAKDWITTLMTEYPQYLVTYEDFVDWFKSNYPTTPECRIDFTSPYDQERIEWYYNNESRVARIDSEVVSYVDYTKQLPDRYLNQTATIDWKGNASDPSNCVDNSLIFSVDALGGGRLRHPPSTLPIPYSGDLRDFSKYYVTLTLAQLETAYRSLLLNYTELKSNFEALNLTLGSLLVNFTKLQAKYDSLNSTMGNMQRQISSLNSTCEDLRELISNLTTTFDSTSNSLQRQISSLNDTCGKFNQSTVRLQTELGSMNSTMQASVNKLQDQYNSQSDQTNTIINVLYIVAALIAALIAATVYLAIENLRKKEEQEKKRKPQ
jgi:prefoldin subunit 5